MRYSLKVFYHIFTPSVLYTRAIVYQYDGDGKDAILASKAVIIFRTRDTYTRLLYSECRSKEVIC